MRPIISKKQIGVLITDIFPKSAKIRISLIVTLSLLLFSSIPYFSGPGLLTPQTIGPYANNAFPVGADFDLDATYRVAFPNLTFFYPIAFKMVPNQEKIVIAQLDGEIFWFDNDESTTTKNVLLDLSSEVGLVSDGGFLGLTIHPEFDAATNPKNYFYVYYCTKNSDGQDLPGFGQYTGQGCYYSETSDVYQGNFVILERFEVDPTTMSFVTGSRTTILKNRMYGTTHYGGGMDFGDDGFLYLTTGEHGSWARAQDIFGNLRGGVLRLDVDKDPTRSHPAVRKMPQDAGESDEITGVEYWIPDDNPFSDNTVGSTTTLYGQPNLTTSDPNDVYTSGDFFEEYYAIGLRNPFRMTKDSGTGTFYIGDVGLNTHEEVDVLQGGSNYGWPNYEGFIAGPGCDPELFNNMAHEEPLLAFSPEDANSITGGFVYRGSAIPELYGKYICADYGSGDEIFSVDTTTGEYVEIATFTPQDIISFGEDNDGELYILNLGFSTNIYKLIDNDDNFPDPPQLLSQTGIFTDLSTLEVEDGFVPYELYEPFWSDGALKRRWIAVPNNDGVHSGPNEQIQYSEYGDWVFPSGTVIVKHFDLKIDDNDPSVTKKIETRVSVVGDDGNMYFLTYNWNEQETDAVLQTTSTEEPVEIATVGGGTRIQDWFFPSNSNCIDCHNEANKGSLGLKARYLNTDYTYPETGLTGNQLVTLSHLGIIDESITDTDTEDIITNKPLNDTNASLDEKARSYLDLNCAYCHRHDNSNRAEFDLRYFNTLEATELLTAGVLSPLGIDPNEKIVFAGDASKSILYHRMNSVDPAIMMPPLAKSIIDEPAVALIEEWINQLDENSTIGPNNPNPIINLALLSSAELSGHIQSSGRGNPLAILYDPSLQDYKITTNFAEYGESYQYNLGTVDAENGFFWRVDWPHPKFVNYITFGGSFPNQPQPNTMWRVSYLREGSWITIEEGQGGWINNGIYVWDGTNDPPKYAEALRLQLYSDGTNDLVSIHIRGRGGHTSYGGDDSGTEPKASLMQFMPFDNTTEITDIIAGTQTNCNPVDNTYTQELTITYTDAPETGSIIVNGQSFPITTSPQTVVLTGLDSDGLGVQIEASFSDGYQTDYKSNGVVFTAPNNCMDLIVGVDETVTFEGDYEVSASGSIEILEGGTLIINGNFTNNGEVILNSVSDKYSSLIVSGTSTGNIKYKRHVNLFNGVTANDLISPPVANQEFGDFASNNPNIFENPNDINQKLFGPFDEPNGAYEIYSIIDNSLTIINSGIGYRAARDASEDGISGTTFTFEGDLQTNSVVVNLTDTNGSYYEGWNLVGNPYSSYIDFDTFFSLNNLELDEGSYKAIYGYDGDSNDGWTILNSVTTGQLIAPGQGFYVRSKTGGGSVTFTPEMRVGGSSDDFILGRSASNQSAHFGHITLNSSSSSNSYNTDIYFNSNATLGLDPGYDAALYGSATDFSLYSNLVQNNTGTPFSIQALGDTDMNDVTIALGVHANQGEEITISISETDMPDNIDIYLEDNLTSTFTLLNTNDYVFTPSSQINGVGRFFIHFENSALSTLDSSLNSLLIFTDNKSKSIVIDGLLQESTNAILYDIHGRKILSQQLNNSDSRQTINASHLSSGIYIIELNNKADKKRIQKLVIQ
ncbi:PQQ-dependent sugar dehydrogenase [Winogradskyella sp. SYSU M77433]|uniref:PQQ-dependent sugar dehydrogenase n=1 Tax=Winogradskyella sp. SYSU M77433 TaxID=3042722 RepID=UPI002480AD0C|nr:PQQ-dependent sugar dehydrogenase [Winogradskyella sp. SYSU M77433]MDH7912344.1 PQQ-dependent sugar dehydrogenase [Winogradskyella sp. SYSU M77433]